MDVRRLVQWEKIVNRWLEDVFADLVSKDKNVPYVQTIDAGWVPMGALIVSTTFHLNVPFSKYLYYRASVRNARFDLITWPLSSEVLHIS